MILIRTSLILVSMCVLLPHVSAEDDEASFPGTELKHAFVVFRHGDRTPKKENILYYPNGPTNTTYAPYGYKALTKAGKLRAYRLGESLRARYNCVIDQTYNESQLIMNVTSTERTKMSALSVLAGMYPPTSDMTLLECLHWTPVPYNEHPKEGRDHENCPKHARKLRPELFETPEVKKITEGLQPLFRRLSNYTGYPISHVDHVAYLRECVRAQNNYGFALPQWFSELSDEMDEAAAFHLQSCHYNDELTRLANGAQLYEFVRRTEQVVSGGVAVPTVQVLSAHEVTVAGVMATVGAYEPHVPKYSAAFALELRRDTSGRYGVAAVYLPSPGEEARVLRMRGCGVSALCDYATFLNATSTTRMSRGEVAEACRYDENQ